MHAVCEPRAGHPGGSEDVALDIVFIVFAGQQLHDPAEHHETEIVIILLRPRGELRSAIGVEGDHFRDAMNARPVGGILHAEQGDVARAGGVREEMPDGDGVGESAVGIIPDHLADPGVERQAAPSDLLQDRHAGEHLAGRRQIEARVDRGFRISLGIQLPIGLLEQDGAVESDEDDARKAVRLRQAKREAVEPGDRNFVRNAGCRSARSRAGCRPALGGTRRGKQSGQDDCREGKLPPNSHSNSPRLSNLMPYRFRSALFEPGGRGEWRLQR